MRNESKQFRIKADQQQRNAQMLTKRAERFYENGQLELASKAQDSADSAYNDMNYYIRLADSALEIEMAELRKTNEREKT